MFKCVHVHGCIQARICVRIQQEVEAEAARLVAQGEHKRKVNACREHIESGLGFAIVEGVALPQCPACKTPFWDFEACFAISCSSCPHKFCGWCFQDCGTSDQEAHRHVASCSEKPAGADPLFGRIEEFHASHKERCRQRVTAYLESLEGNIRADVEREMAQTLRALGVVVQD